jgi:hypothetical protein
MFIAFLLASIVQIAQAAMPGAPPDASAIVLNTGPCLDSPRSVPQVLQAPAVTARQLVRIDKVVSTATMTENEVIGFLYTQQDGTLWLGQRSAQYMSPAQAAQINQVLASTHMPSETATAFPPQTRLGVKTNFQQFFRVQVPATSLAALQIRIDPCVAWPTGRQLPDPSL